MQRLLLQLPRACFDALINVNVVEQNMNLSVAQTVENATSNAKAVGLISRKSKN